MEKLLDHAPFEASGVERLGTGSAVGYTWHEQSEDVSDIQSEGDSSHTIAKNEEYARFHTSPGPSRHLEPLLDLCADLVSGHRMVEVSQKAILDSDDECNDEERLIRDGCSSAHPIMNSPDAVRVVKSTREVTGATPHPLTPDFSLPRTSRDRVPERDELVAKDERDDLARKMDVDTSKR
eukprot:8424355-Pyramimonas_sp.AAC.1